MGTYKVTGNRNYRGHDPGETFTENLSEAEERRATTRGSIEVVDGKAPASPGGNDNPHIPEEFRKRVDEGKE